MAEETTVTAPKSRVGRANRGAKPGERRGGRPKGGRNKLTVEVKTAIVEAFEKAGGVDYLVAVAKDNPQVFCTLLGKVLPLQVSGEGGKPIEIRWGDMVDVTPSK